MPKEITFEEISKITESALKALYPEAEKPTINARSRDEENHMWVSILFGKSGDALNRSAFFGIDLETSKVKEFSWENPKITTLAPEQRLLKLLEEGISMGKFDAVKAQREVWDDFTSR